MSRFALVGVFLTFACNSEPAALRHALRFQVLADEGVPVPSAEIRSGDRLLGTSDENGMLEAELEGKEGITIPVSVRCPEGHRAPTGPTSLRLRSFEVLNKSSEKRLVTTFRCPPAKRTAILVVRTENAPPGLPVHVDGVLVAKTDAFGTAHVPLHIRPADRITARLDTSAHPGLRPLNPQSVFTMPDGDELFLFSAPFAAAPKPRPKPAPRPSAPPPPRLPQRIH